MSITRRKLEFERNKGTTEIPNVWARGGVAGDRKEKLSRGARGLLTELLSHAEGWKTSITQLVLEGPEGRAAIRAMIEELEAQGYLTRTFGRDEKGHFETDWDLSDPTSKPVDNSLEEAENDRVRKSHMVQLPHTGNRTLKKDQVKEDLEQSSKPLTLVGPVDNFDDDQVSHPVINFPTPSNVHQLHPTAIDRSQLATSVGFYFVDAGITDDQLHQLALEILAKAAAHVSNPTRYVIQAIRNDVPVYQRRAFDMAAELHARGGNPF